MGTAPVLWWVRRDFRRADNPALLAAIATGQPVIPVFVHDETTHALGAAPAWRLGLAIDHFATELTGQGSRLILRRGTALDVLRDVLRETGATGVFWNRLYDPIARDRDTQVKAALKADGVTAISTSGHTLTEPWTIKTGQGGFYRVYTPYFRAVWAQDIAPPRAAPNAIPAPDHWPHSDALAAWRLDAAMHRGAKIVRPHLCLGAAAAAERLEDFVAQRMARYDADRDRLDLAGASGLSEPLSYGEISPRQCYWAAASQARTGDAGAMTFVKQLIWRDFAYHLVFHTPHITTANWRRDWDKFPWSEAESEPVNAWRQGRTGIEVVDAAMREIYVTGRMHNRARMLVASYLTKHLMTHWRIGLDWFADCLVDWDPAANAMGWQWAAGSGPDATPYFRIFNPETQAAKFDPNGDYRQRWLGPSPEAAQFFQAIPRRWNLTETDPYPAAPIVGLAAGRARALAAYADRDF
ncbi:MAG: deoxyribodipyrimidine photo-lyase [Pseudomonadota bacterium]